MVTPDRLINHTFDRLEDLIQHCTRSGSMVKLDDIITDLNMIMLDRKATGTRLIKRSVRILDGRAPYSKSA